MSWGATGYTPIRVFNEPPFGFDEVINPPDFPVCNENPWGTGDRIKSEIQERLREAQHKRNAFGDEQYEWDMGYDYDWCMTYPDYVYESFEMQCDRIQAEVQQGDICIYQQNKAEIRKNILAKFIAGSIWFIGSVMVYAFLAIIGGMIGGIASTYDKK